MNPILLFSIATVVNVTLSTVRAICTIKGGKMLSAITNAVCYGFYPLIVMLTAQGTVDIIVNMVITAVANFVCVYLIKMGEEKARKDKLWKVEATVKADKAEEVKWHFEHRNIPYSYIDIGKYVIFNAYCRYQFESLKVKEILNEYNAKYFVSESKTL